MKSKVESIISGLSKDWNADERETSILFDHHERAVYLETTEPFTARRWHELLKDDPQAIFSERSDSLRIQIPADYCRKPELILLPKYRKAGREALSAV